MLYLGDQSMLFRQGKVHLLLEDAPAISWIVFA